MVLGMVDSPLGPASPDASFILVRYVFQHDSPVSPSLFAALMTDNVSLVANSFRCSFLACNSLWFLYQAFGI